MALTSLGYLPGLTASNLTTASTTTVANRTPTSADGLDGDGWIFIPTAPTGRIALYVKSSGAWSATPTKLPLVGADGGIVGAYGGTNIASGCATWPRQSSNGNTVSLPSGTVRFSFFEASSTFTATQLVAFSGGTAAAGGTYAALGVYSVNADGSLTLLGATASDTALFTGADATAYTRALTTSVPLAFGTAYAVGCLFVGTTGPTTHGQASSIFDSATLPFIGASLTGQSTLPATVTAASLVGSSSTMYVKLLP